MEKNLQSKIKALLSYDAVVIAILAVVVAGTLALNLTNYLLPNGIKIPYAYRTIFCTSIVPFAVAQGRGSHC